MPSPQPESDEVSATRMPPVALRTWLVLAAIIVLGVLLRGARLGEAPGGFHVFNEGYYIDLATRMAQHPAFAWFFHPLDVNNPPLYPVLVSWLYRFGAPHIAGARIISVLAGAWSVFATFLLGRLLYSERTGIVAAAVLAVMPGAVLVDHNIQVDPLFVALLLTSVLLYILAVRTGSKASALVGGAALGLSFLAKQPAFMLLPALAVWETWCTHSLRWLTKGRVWRFVVGFVVVSVPWYLAQVAVKNIGPMFANAAHIRGESVTVLGSIFWNSWVLHELSWMLFPLTALLAVAGLVYAGWKRRAGDKLVLVLAGTYFGWYMVFHQHPYYLLPLAPVLALAAGRLCTGLFADRIPWVWARVALVVTLVVVMAFASVVMLGGQKWGRWSPMTFDPKPDAGFSAVHLYYNSAEANFFGPTIGLMPPQVSPTPTTTAGFFAAPEKPGVENLFLAEIGTTTSGGIVPALRPVMETWIRPVLFGYAIGQTTLQTPENIRLNNSQYFTNAPWTAERVGPWWRFGVQSTPLESGLYLYNKASFMELNSQ